MNKQNIGFIVFCLIILSLVFYGFSNFKNFEESQSVSSESTLEVNEVVSQFGRKLNKVSLLSSKEVLSQSLDSEYGEYVSSDLLLEWKNNPTLALGRQTSRPWPDRIQIATTQKINSSTYEVLGNIIEVTNDNLINGDISGVLPVTLELKNKNNKWLITKVTKGDYSNIPHRETLVGIYTCLPHKDISGPQTMECAFGIKTDDGNYYALNTMLMASVDIIPTLKTGDRIKVEGPLVPVEQLSSIQKYDIKGVMNVTMIQKIQ